MTLCWLQLKSTNNSFSIVASILLESAIKVCFFKLFNFVLRADLFVYLSCLSFLSIFLTEPVLRKWTNSLKKDELSGLLRGTTKTGVGQGSRFQSMSISWNALNTTMENKMYSVKNTVELVNSKQETVLKVCFTSPLAALSWVDGNCFFLGNLLFSFLFL